MILRAAIELMANLVYSQTIYQSLVEVCIMLFYFAQGKLLHDIELVIANKEEEYEIKYAVFTLVANAVKIEPVQVGARNCLICQKLFREKNIQETLLHELNHEIQDETYLLRIIFILNKLETKLEEIEKVANIAELSKTISESNIQKLKDLWHELKNL